jgi:hypothetical protein
MDAGAGTSIHLTDENLSAGALGHCELCFHGASEAEVVACEMTVPHELEAEVLEEIGSNRETVVAFAVLRRGIAE